MTAINVAHIAISSVNHVIDTVLGVFQTVGQTFHAAQQMRANYMVAEHLVGKAGYEGMTHGEIAVKLNRELVRSL